MKNATQNVAFVGRDPDDKGVDHPVGYGIAHLLHDAVNQPNLIVSEIENWRDIGWSFRVGNVNQNQIEIGLTGTFGENLWLARICSRKRPTLYGWIFGNQSPDQASEIYDNSIAIDGVLRSNDFTDICWRLNGQPMIQHDPPHPIDNTGTAG